MVQQAQRLHARSTCRQRPRSLRPRTCASLAVSVQPARLRQLRRRQCFRSLRLCGLWRRRCWRRRQTLQPSRQRQLSSRSRSKCSSSKNNQRSQKTCRSRSNHAWQRHWQLGCPAQLLVRLGHPSWLHMCWAPPLAHTVPAYQATRTAAQPVLAAVASLPAAAVRNSMPDRLLRRGSRWRLCSSLERSSARGWHAPAATELLMGT